MTKERRRLRVLILEDNPSDAELMAFELRRGGFDPQWTRVETASDFDGALDQPPDLILADYTVPQFNAPAALQRLRARQLDVPFIVVTGSVGEGPAVECLKNGAADYLLKDRLARLPTAVERALEQRALRDQKRNADAELRSNREYLHRLLNSSPAIIYACDPSNGYAARFMSENVTSRFGYTPHEMVGDPAFWPDRIHPDDRARVSAALDDLLTTGRFSLEYRFRHANGSYRWISDQATLMLDEHAQPCEVVGFWIDVTDRKRAEQALAEREQHFRRLIENATDVIAVLDVTGRIEYESPAIERVSGFKPEEMVGKSSFEFIHPDDLPALEKLFLESISKAGVVRSAQFRHRHRDGGWRVLEAIGTPLVENGEVVGGVVNSRDVTARCEAEAAVRKVEAFRSAIEESMRGGVIVFDANGKITYANNSFARIVGRPVDEIVGCAPPYPYWAPESVEALTRTLHDLLATNEAPTAGIEARFLRPDGSRIDVMIWPSPLVENGVQTGWLSAVYDDSDRKQLEQRLRQAQKMEAVGRLAGGVAHDFNNLLTAIIGYSDLLLSDLPEDDRMRSDLSEISRAGRSAEALTRQLLAFSRRQILEPTVLDLNVVIAEMLKILRRTIGEDVKLETEFAAPLGLVLADRGQIEQVVVNLSVNSRDAMPKGGRITLSTSDVTLDKPVRHGRWEIPPGHFVRLCVHDTGSGMSPHVLEHLFEPFFTTKPRGSGTGLGLPTVYGIVAQSGGHIGVESDIDKGTRMFVYLPVTLAEASKSSPDVPPARIGGTETVLVVDDSDVIRNLARSVLRAHGYTVLTAADGSEALRIVQSRVEPIHLLLTDVVMPGMSGLDLSRALQLMRPSLRCLYTSGYTDDSLVRHGLETGSVAFLQKPFTPESLLRKVRETLERPVLAAVYEK